MSGVVHPNGRLRWSADGLPAWVSRASGCWLWDDAGRRYLDAISGLMCVNVGYGRSSILEAAAEGVDLSYATLFFGRSHRCAHDLAVELEECTPDSISAFYFTSGGSEANDSALRFVRMLNVAEGRPHRTKILARLGSYHGATLATISAGGDQRRHRAIGIRMPGFVDLSQPREGFDALGELRQVITDEGPETIAAMIAEPIAYQAGMIVPPDEYWPGVADLCRQHGIALIVDEVLTGFGRTGRMFACEHWGLQPDVLTMSKGLTSGYAPLGAVGLSTEMRMRLESALDGGEGVLGFTSTGHPLSCRVALANLAVIGDERLVERSMRMGQHLRGQLDRLRARESRIAEYRVMGLLAAVDLWIGSEERSQALCQMVVREMAGQGVLARPFGRAVALAPPLVISDEELNFMVDALAAAVAKAAAIFDN